MCVIVCDYLLVVTAIVGDCLLVWLMSHVSYCIHMYACARVILCMCVCMCVCVIQYKQNVQSPLLLLTLHACH